MPFWSKTQYPSSVVRLVEQLAQGRVAVSAAGVEMDGLVAAFTFPLPGLGLAVGTA